MVDFEKFLNSITLEGYYDKQISHVQHLPKRNARYGELKTPLNKRLHLWLRNNDIQFWKHQAEAINSIMNGQNTVIVTSTASGKSLCYNLPVLNSLLNDEKTTALYIFPTKALARDQYLTLFKIMEDIKIKRTRLGIYDGSIDSSEKRQVLENANIIITNPFGLHLYLPWFKQKWYRICHNLKYIVLDEIHIYNGIFGSNFALLLRRLKRILEAFNVKPLWILSSATIKNSKAFAEKLIGEKVIVIEKDHSPSVEKKIILWDLPYDEASGKYRSSHQETKNVYITHLKSGIQTLTFTLSRKMAELQAIWTKESLFQIRDKIVSYRAGISKIKRREIESKLKRKEILGVSSTNALELGIDIGSLDAIICSGFPGTLSSFWQQVGRSGRGENLSIATLIPMQNPLDMFYVHNPDILFGPIQEEVLITLKNKYIIKNHLCCAAKEIPLTINDYKKFNVEDEVFFETCIEELIDESLLMKRGDKYYWKGDFFPNDKYGLSYLSSRSYKVILKSITKDQVLTTEDESYVFRDLHPGAVYLYEAETYLVGELDLIERIVYITKANVDFYTQSLKHTDITPIEVISQDTSKNIKKFFGNVKVEHEYYSFKVIDTLTQEIRARNPLVDLPVIEFETQSVWFLIPFEYQKELELAGHDLGGTIHAIEHAMIAIAPTLAQISRWDLGGISIDFDPVNQQPIIYIYDAYKGGIGISELLYHELNQLLGLTYKLIRSCKCTAPNGCPICILSSRCGSGNEPIDKMGALFLLKRLIEKI